VGANRDSPDRAADYAAGVTRFAAVADYIAINISSPNTPGLRDLQERQALTGLLRRVSSARATASRRVPILVKLAPDLDDAALAAAIETIGEAEIDGLIVGNTTLARDGLRDTRAREAGGMSGRPLFRRSTIMLAKARRLAGTDLVIIGVGGVDSPEAAWTKLIAGANLVQLYTGMIFEGPGLPARIAYGLAARLDRERIGSITDIVATGTDRWSKQTP
jgi:dihydroorotate dehydrogenase